MNNRGTPLVAFAAWLWMAFAATPPAGAATPAPPALRSFAAQLRSAAHAIDRAAEAPGRSASTLSGLHLGPAPLPGPPRFSPSLDDWMQGALASARREKSDKSRRADLRALAASLRRAASIAGADHESAPSSRVDAAIAAILAQPEYRTPQIKAQPYRESWWQRFWEWFFDKLGTLFGKTIEAATGVPAIGDILAIVLVAVAATGFAFLCFRIAVALSARRPRDRGASAEGEALTPELESPSVYRAACDAARAGSYAQAVALLFQAALLDLDHSGRVAYDPARTAGEYRRVVRRAAASGAASFDELANAFVVAAYADRRLTQADWADADRAYRALPDMARAAT